MPRKLILLYLLDLQGRIYVCARLPCEPIFIQTVGLFRGRNKCLKINVVYYKIDFFARFAALDKYISL